MTHIYEIRLEGLLAGSNIEDVIDEALNIANTHKCVARFTFNGAKMEVAPADTKEALLRDYLNKLAQAVKGAIAHAGKAKAGFQIGHYYKHTTGKRMHIVGEADTYQYGQCLVGEVAGEPDMIPVGMHEENFRNWTEITEKEFVEEEDPYMGGVGGRNCLNPHCHNLAEEGGCYCGACYWVVKQVHPVALRIGKEMAKEEMEKPEQAPPIKTDDGEWPSWEEITLLPDQPAAFAFPSCLVEEKGCLA